MNISQLLEALKSTSTNLTISEKLLAGVSVAALSMTVVFIVLVLISIIINLLQREKSKITQNMESEINNLDSEVASCDNDNMEELVSVITAAISASTGNSTNNIIVRNIQRTNNPKTNWERMSKSITK